MNIEKVVEELDRNSELIKIVNDYLEIQKNKLSESLFLMLEEIYSLILLRYTHEMEIG